MLTALINGILGVALTYGVGTWVLGMESSDILQALIASILSGLVAVLSILAIGRNEAFKRIPIGGTVKTWTLFLFFYFGGMLLAAPVLRSTAIFWPLFIPLVLSTGFSIVFFGPIQDRIIAGLQRRQDPRVGDGSPPGP